MSDCDPGGEPRQLTSSASRFNGDCQGCRPRGREWKRELRGGTLRPAIENGPMARGAGAKRWPATQSPSGEGWRRGGDSNPRSHEGSRDFESRRLNLTPEPLRKRSAFMFVDTQSRQLPRPASRSFSRPPVGEFGLLPGRDALELGRVGTWSVFTVGAERLSRRTHVLVGLAVV